MMSKTVIAAMVLALLAGGCGAHRAKRTGFLSDYSDIRKASRRSDQYQSPSLGHYHRFIIDPVEVRPYGQSKMTDEQSRELAAYLHNAVLHALTGDYQVVTDPGPQIARLRIAITDVRASKWYLNLHPGMKLTRAGAGEAAIEAEIVDSISGEQLLAVVESQKGNPLELDMFSKYDDAHDVMDSWAKRLRKLLDHARQ